MTRRALSWEPLQVSYTLKIVRTRQEGLFETALLMEHQTLPFWFDGLVHRRSYHPEALAPPGIAAYQRHPQRITAGLNGFVAALWPAGWKHSPKIAFPWICSV